MCSDCPLCSASLGPIITESEHWSLILNRNQDLLGKCFLVLRRHAEEVILLSDEEWLELKEQLKQVTHALISAFNPDHFNYAFLQNQDRHVHIHIIPRYESNRNYLDIDFRDIGYPGHYLISEEPKLLTEEIFVSIADELRNRINGIQAI